MFFNTPITIDDFMQNAVSYYYAHKESVGGKGDFITSPEISQMFGEVLGAWCAAEYYARGQEAFCLVELGAGNGTMMDDILRATKNIKGFHEDLKQIIIMENSRYLRARQRERLHKYLGKLTWIDSINQIPKSNVIILANEFLDALPIKQFKRLGNKFFEVGITSIDSKYWYTEIDEAYIDYPECPERGIVETCEAAVNIVKHLLSRASGYTTALFIDYGYFSSPFVSTLQAVKDHKTHDVLSDIGEADITALVDFGTLFKLFKESGFIATYLTQREFLLQNDIEFRAKKLISCGANPLNIENDLHRLISTSDMGSLFKVLEIKSYKFS